MGTYWDGSVTVYRKPIAIAVPSRRLLTRALCCTPERKLNLDYYMLPLRPPPGLAAVLTEEDLFEGLPKDLVEDGVENRIDHAAGVAEPRDEIEDPVADVLLAVAADGGHQVEHEERGPQDDERKEDDAQHFGGFLLQPNDAAVSRRVPRDDTRVARVMRPNRGRSLQEARRRRQLVTGFGYNEIRFELKTLVVESAPTAATTTVHACIEAHGGRPAKPCLRRQCIIDWRRLWLWLWRSQLK